VTELFYPNSAPNIAESELIPDAARSWQQVLLLFGAGVSASWLFYHYLINEPGEGRRKRYAADQNTKEATASSNPPPPKEKV